MYCPILTLVIITSCSLCHLIIKAKTAIRAVAKLVSLVNSHEDMARSHFTQNE